MTNNSLKFVEINGFRIYYYDSLNDPIIDYLKDGKLHGAIGYQLLSSYLPSDNQTVIDCGAHIGTFSVEPVRRKHKVFMIENDKNYQSCLNHTYSGYDNTQISESHDYDIDSLCSKHNLENISAIRYSIQGKENNAIQNSRHIISEYSPLLLVEINSPKLLENGSSPNEIISKLESMRYHCFLYNGANFLIKLDKTSRFPFCQMAIIGMHESYVLNNLGKISFGAYIDDKMLDSLIKDNKSTTNNRECQDYLESL